MKKSFLKEQLKTVCDLSNELYNSGLPTYFISGGSANVSYHPRFFNFFKQHGIEPYQQIFLKTSDIDKILPFTNYQHNILLPKPIAAIIKKFNIQLESTQTDKLPPKYMLILHKQENPDTNLRYYLYMNYDDFYTLSIELVTEITKWLERFGAIDINLPDHMKKNK